MSPKDLILKIVKAYQDARIPQQVDARIRRGRSHSISSVTEDLFAHFLISNDSTIDVVYVDQPIYFKNAEKQIYPDIVIVRKNSIAGFIDIKMDLGWNRNGLFELCKKHYEMIKKIKGVECHLRDGETKQLRNLRVAENVSYNVVIISRTNINAALLESQLEQVRSFSPNLDVFVLCDKGHPNSYGIEPEKLVEELGINDKEFERLKTKLS